MQDHERKIGDKVFLLKKVHRTPPELKPWKVHSYVPGKQITIEDMCEHEGHIYYKGDGWWHFAGLVFDSIKEAEDWCFTYNNL